MLNLLSLQTLACTRPIQLPDLSLASISIGSSDLATQSLPLSYVASWPTWIATPDGSAVTMLPEPTEGGFVNPLAFEQLWLPLDLPLPTCRAAIGAVLKDGVPRYLFPSMEATVTTGAQQVWHNRGLNTVPMAKTWLAFGDVPVDSLRLSCYRSDLPENDNDDSDDEETAEWSQVLPLTPVSSTMETIFNVIANAPDALGEGFCFLLAPIPESVIPASAACTSSRVRLFLSDVDATPTSLDPEERDQWVWARGECDMSIYQITPGGQSDFLPQQYKPLFDSFTGPASLLS
jgi:hypothetical protein